MVVRVWVFTTGGNTDGTPTVATGTGRADVGDARPVALVERVREQLGSRALVR